MSKIKILTNDPADPKKTVEVFVDTEATYKPRKMAKLGLIQNTRGRASYYYILDLIHAGKLKAEHLDTPSQKYNGVSGAEIIRYRKENNFFVGE